jgi:molybdopterin/thiamine biosynthesis adenylyltransferase
MPSVLRPGMIDEDRFERSKRVGWIEMEAVGRSHCLVVGAGALGNEVVKDLVLSGFRYITLVDMDRVVRSNLNRCVFFREEDAAHGRMKAEVVAARARELDPDVDIVPQATRIEDLDPSVFRQHEVVLGCLDNVAARLHANAHAYHARIPFIDGGTLGTSGKVQVVLPPTSPCVQCASNRTHFRDMDKRHSCTGSDAIYHEPKLAAEITTTSVVAAIQVREALKIVSGRADDCVKHVLHYNGLTNLVEAYELEIDPVCSLHSMS